MTRLTLQVAGESHGEGLTGILAGLPRGVPLDLPLAEHWLTLRRQAAGRGPRMAMERDRFSLLSGVKDGVTTGGPVSFFVENADRTGGSVTPENRKANLEFPRPGHGDLAGALKWGLDNASAVAELSSARITAAHTLGGALCQSFLGQLGVVGLAHVVRVGPVRCRARTWQGRGKPGPTVEKAEASPWLVLDRRAASRMDRAVGEAREQGDTLGGVFEVVYWGLPPGLGAPQPVAQRVDGRLGAALLTIPGVKAAAVGAGLEAWKIPGSKFHDPIVADGRGGFARTSNRAGGIEGGMTNGEPLVVQGVVKPIASLSTPIRSISLKDGKSGSGQRVRSDVCVAAPAAIVARAQVAQVLAELILESTGGDTLEHVVQRLKR